jgi:mono/diheme cytochrome c family protein
MNKTPFILFGIFALICVIVIPVVALGKNGDEDAATVKVASRDRDAQELFATNCGTCHTLAAGGTDGVVGPNLDMLLVPSAVNSSQQFDGISTRVMQAVTCGIGGRMPRGILEPEEAQEVAKFVAAYAGQIGEGPTVDTATAKNPAVPDPSSCASGSSGSS